MLNRYITLYVYLVAGLPNSQDSLFNTMNNPTPTTLEPREVFYARFLLFGSLLLGLVPLPFDVMDYVLQEQHGFAIFLGALVAVFVALTMLLISKIKQRKNWARWVIGVVVFLSFVSTLTFFEKNWNESAGRAALDCLTGLMDLFAVGILFARRSNDWFANQSGIHPPYNPTDGVGKGMSGVTSMGYSCPCCGLRIAFFSKTVQAMGKRQSCPYCNKKIKRDFAYGKFFTLMFVVGLPIKLLGKAIPLFSFFGSSITTALISAFLIMLCTHYKEDLA